MDSALDAVRRVVSGRLSGAISVSGGDPCRGPRPQAVVELAGRLLRCPVLAEAEKQRVRRTEGAFRRIASLLLTEVEPYRWTGKLTPLVEGERLWGVRSDYVREGESASAIELVASDERSPGVLELARGYATGRSWVSAGGPGESTIEARVAGAWLGELAEHRAVADFYGERRAERSGVPLIAHIYEGLAVLRALGAAEVVLRGFCLHPLVQGDEALRSSLGEGRLSSCDPEAVALALEYRSVANGFLSSMETHSGYDDPRAIRRSPLAEVDAMLIADKIQNAKDFGLYHRRSHPRASWLARYFDAWLVALEVPPAQARRLTSLVTAPLVRVETPEQTSESSV